MTPDEARALAAATLAAMDNPDRIWDQRILSADRERVESALRAAERAEEGLLAHRPAGPGLNYRPERDGPLCRVCVHGSANVTWPCSDATRYTEARADADADLARTARLYGVPT